MNSILNYVKKHIGIAEEDTSFDTDLIGDINTSLTFLYRMGVPASPGFVIEDDTAVWSDYLPNIDECSFIKTYVWIKAKLVFDPPASATILESYKETLKEIEFTIDDKFNYQGKSSTIGKIQNEDIDG